MRLSRLRTVIGFVCLAWVSGLAVPAVQATSFAPVSFQDLVTRADVIFVGDVLNVQPFTVATPEGTAIKTRVTFMVRDAIWGTTQTLESFEFLGGVVGNRELRVAEMPTFKAGDRRMVFASRTRSINPIIGFTQGLMRVSADPSGVDVVQTSDGAPLASLQDIGRPNTARLRSGRAMPLSSLRAQVVTLLRERRR